MPLARPFSRTPRQPRADTCSNDQGAQSVGALAGEPVHVALRDLPPHAHLLSSERLAGGDGRLGARSHHPPQAVAERGEREVEQPAAPRSLIVKLRLAQDDAFCQKVTRVRDSPDPARAAWNEAWDYASARPRRVVERLLLDAARTLDGIERHVGPELQPQALKEWATVATFIAEWKPAASKYKPYLLQDDFRARTIRSAEVLARRGACRCLALERDKNGRETACATPVSRRDESYRREYCRRHEPPHSMPDYKTEERRRVAEWKDVELTLGVVASAVLPN